MKNFEKITDEKLIEAILNSNKDAIGELYSRYYKKVFQKCMSLVKDPDVAFDLAEEAFMKAIDNLKSFRRESSFSTWLYIITHRYCLETLRKKSKEIVKTSDFVLDEANQNSASLEDEMNSEDIEKIMQTLINKLPASEKEMLLLKYRNGESIETLQSMFKISASAVKMRLKRTKDKLNQVYLVAITLGLTEALTQLG